MFPAIERNRPIYAQLRRLRPRPDQPKFLNVSGVLATNPKVARYRPVEARSDIVVVTEGPIDALSAAAAGFRAVAVLGAASVDPDVAAQLAATPGRLVLAFDADTAGRTGSERLERMLRDVQRPARSLSLPEGVNDLNDWLRVEGRSWTVALDASVTDAITPRRAGLRLG
ncbi:MAG: toprim domain-containing protein [Acidimicrobiia bacterium]